MTNKFTQKHTDFITSIENKDFILSGLGVISFILLLTSLMLTFISFVIGDKELILLLPMGISFIIVLFCGRHFMKNKINLDNFLYENIHFFNSHIENAIINDYFKLDFLEFHNSLNNKELHLMQDTKIIDLFYKLKDLEHKQKLNNIEKEIKSKLNSDESEKSI